MSGLSLFFKRTLALGIDTLLFMPVWIFEIRTRGEDWSVLLMAIVSIASWCGIWVYRSASHALFGTTVGKRVVGLRVYGLDNGRPRIGLSTLREMPYFVLGFGFVLAYYLGNSDQEIAVYAIGIKIGFFVFFVLDIATLLFRGDGRTLHDLIGNTYVASGKTATQP